MAVKREKEREGRKGCGYSNHYYFEVVVSILVTDYWWVLRMVYAPAGMSPREGMGSFPSRPGISQTHPHFSHAYADSQRSCQIQDCDTSRRLIECNLPVRSDSAAVPSPGSPSSQRYCQIQIRKLDR